MGSTNRFTAWVLAAALATASLLMAVPAMAQGYVVRGGDTLRIEVLQDTTLNRDVLVTPDGTITFPFAGTLRASGRTPAQISQLVATALAPNFATEPNVFVAVRRVRPEDPLLPEVEAQEIVRVYLLGEINSPGLKELPPGVTLLQALSLSGGFTNFAALKRLQLRRTDPVSGLQSVSTINYRAIANGAALSQDVRLVEGDVILVPQRRLFE